MVDLGSPAALSRIRAWACGASRVAAPVHLREQGGKGRRKMCRGAGRVRPHVQGEVGGASDAPHPSPSRTTCATLRPLLPPLPHRRHHPHDALRPHSPPHTALPPRPGHVLPRRTTRRRHKSEERGKSSALARARPACSASQTHTHTRTHTRIEHKTQTRPPPTGSGVWALHSSAPSADHKRGGSGERQHPPTRFAR